MKTLLLVLFYSVQAVTLIVAGCATLWWSEPLMVWLIWLIGEERALGADNVIHTEGGGKLLTNPVAMMKWTIPFWILGCVQISAGFTLLRDCQRRIARAGPSSATAEEEAPLMVDEAK